MRTEPGELELCGLNCAAVGVEGQKPALVCKGAGSRTVTGTMRPSSEHRAQPLQQRSLMHKRSSCRWLSACPCPRPASVFGPCPVQAAQPRAQRRAAPTMGSPQRDRRLCSASSSASSADRANGFTASAAMAAARAAASARCFRPPPHSSCTMGGRRGRDWGELGAAH